MNFFPNIRRFSWKSKKSQKWNTTAQRSASGMERTMTTQFYPSWTIEASFPAITDEEARILQGFVAGQKGANEPFWWLDPEDYQATNQVLAPISATQYQAVMLQGSFVEPVEHIDNVTVRVGGSIVTNYSLNGGVITFASAPSGEVTADYRYYWKMKLANDGIDIERIFDNVNKCSFKLEVVR